MNVGAWNFYEQLSTDNFMFTHADAPIGDSLLRPFNMLYAQAKAKGIKFRTLDLVERFDEMDAYLFMDMPSVHPLVEAAFRSKKPRYLVLWENALVKPDNWLPQLHNLFEKIFTWDDTLVDNKRYFKINYAHLFPPRPGVAHTSPRKLCTMISCNKTSGHPMSLYRERLRAVEWFEEHAPWDFDLYGMGWDQSQRSSYRGSIQSKRPMLASHRFAIAYENAKKQPGYITEKIFDCFFAGTVPIYWGAPNVAEHIPSTCYIDARGFEIINGGGIDYPALYRYMTEMPDARYLQYLDAAAAYLQSEQAQAFTAQRFVDTIINGLGG